MKAFSNSKRGSTVVDAPERIYAPATAEVAWAGPAPAGALHRARGGPYERIEDTEGDDELYVPAREKAGSRWRGVVKSVAGRIVLGIVVLVGLAASATGVIFARNYFMQDARFVIPAFAHIETVGNTHLTRAQLLSVFGGDVDRNIFRVPLAERRADVERLPWVQHATVMRLLPNTLRVSVVERTPVAFVRQGTSIGLVDPGGVLLDMPADAPGDPHYSFPVLTGISASDPLSMRAARMEIYRRFMRELDSSGEKISDNLSEVDVSSPEDVKALIASGSTDILVHFGEEDFLARYRHFQEHLPEWKQQYPKLASADMRYDRQVVLEMAAGAGVPSTEVVASNSAEGAHSDVKGEVRKIDAAAASPAPTSVQQPALQQPALQQPALQQPARPSEQMEVHARGPVARAVSIATPKTRAAVPKTSAANAKMFAALAAERRRQMKNSGQGPQ